MILESWGISDIGSKRIVNEDFFYISDEHHLYIIADGMGGHAGGECASKMAVMTIKDIMHTLRNSRDFNDYFDPHFISDDHGASLKNALEFASTTIATYAQTHTLLKGMGTTCTAITIVDREAYVAHVGDSRLYRLRNNMLSQLTEDHSLVNEQIKMGVLSKNDAKKHAYKNIITRSIGVSETVEVDSFHVPLQKDDLYLLATDGLSNLVTEDEIQKTLTEYNIPTASRKLIEMANANGGDDNVTVVLVKVIEV